MGLGSWTDDILHEAGQIWRSTEEMFDTTVRLGVTGLSRSGKTVFITALVASLLNRSRMRLLAAEAEGRILAATLRPQPDPGLPRFPFEANMAKLTGRLPEWPVPTAQISQLRVSMKVKPVGLLSGLTGPETVHLDIVDYPGEWLLDLPLIEQSYSEWSRSALAALDQPARMQHGEAFRAALAEADPAGPHDEVVAERLAERFRDYLQSSRDAGLSSLAPGRFLNPGDMAGSPALTFAPLPGDAGRRGSLWSEMADRYEAYKRLVVRPFFKDHFARLDRQVVLVDALGALARGPRALGDLTGAMADTLEVFRHGRPSWIDRLLGGRRIDRLLFVASKADHLHHTQHPQLTRLVEAMLAEARRRAHFKGAEARAMAIAAIRASSEQTIRHEGTDLDVVRGVREADRKEVALFPGALPEDPAALLAEAGTAPETWADGGSYDRPTLAPPRWAAAQEGPPHIRLDRAIDFLIGDKLE